MAVHTQPRWRGTLAGVAAVLLAFGWATACGSIGGSGAAPYAQEFRPDGSAAVTPGQVLPIELGDMYFRPNSLTAEVGAAVSLRLHNASPIVHNFTLTALGISRNVPPGGTVQVSFTAPPAGTYYFLCDVPGHAADGMVGRLVVR